MTDIEIAQSAEMQVINKIADKIGIPDKYVENYGKYKAKVDYRYLQNELKDKEDGKLILVTAINPTPAGEGKTTTTIGLGDALNKMGKKTIIAVREPSLGPVFGVKGGAADMHRLFLWKTSTFTLQATSMQSAQLTTFLQLCSTTTFIREMLLTSIQRKSFGEELLI